MSRYQQRPFVRCAIIVAGLLSLSPAVAEPGEEPAGRYVSLIQRHYDRLLKVGLDEYGPEETAMWLASIDVRRGGQYEAIPAASRRVYRTIHAPRGSTLYWDQPALVTAYLLSDLTAEPRYAEAADRYVEDFLARCISAENGLFLWGNHLWYQVFADRVEVIGSPYHETRPLPPAWPVFWRIDRKATDRAIRAMGRFHVRNPETGEFDRHADARAREPSRAAAEYPFIESGGGLVDALCWLAAQAGGDEDLVEQALRIARFSFDSRSAQTGLVRNQRGNRRWDYHGGTTEVGHWAGSLLRAARYSGREEFRTMAAESVAAYLEHGFDPRAGKFYGTLRVDDGSPDLDFDASYPYRPGRYSDIWEPLFPTHDYPMAMAEACIDLYLATGEEVFRTGARRWAEHVQNSLPASYARVESGFPSVATRRAQNRDEPRVAGAYAGHYGRVIHFLARSAEVFDEPPLRRLAEKLADEAVDLLFVEEAGMFRSNPERHTCDAVDEPGTLFLALLYLETGRSAENWGFHF